MIGMLMRGDRNSDGILTEDEMPAAFADSFGRLDTNSDGQLDSSELDAMAKQFAERRASSRTSARDPIVYGVAAAEGIIVIRTGTRLYGIAGTGEQLSLSEVSP